MMITSSPYWLQRDYGTQWICLGGDPECNHNFHMKKGYKMHKDSSLTGRGFEAMYGMCKCGAYAGEFGLEPTSDMFIDHYLILLKEIARVLKPEGTMWIEIGDKYGSPGYGKPTSKAFIPEKLAIRITDELDLYCRNDIILYRVPSRPESLKTRFSKKYAHLYLFTKQRSGKHYFDLESAKVEGKDGKLKNPGDVWTISSSKIKGSNTASFSLDVLDHAVLAGCPRGGTVLDPFNGIGHTTYVAKSLNRNYIGFELLKENYETSIRLMKSIEVPIV